MNTNKIIYDYLIRYANRVSSYERVPLKEGAVDPDEIERADAKRRGLIERIIKKIKQGK